MYYQRTILENGITVLSETMPSVHSISLGLWFNVGSRDEREDQAGLAHFMEHMMFKGTPTRGPLDISMHFDRLGAELNAFTSKECTCYYARFVEDKLESALEVLSDMLIRSEFAQEAIDTEREVVIEEIARAEDAPDDYVYELFNRSLITNHPVGLPVLGTRERVGSYTQADCLEFHKAHYHTGNLVVAAAGNVEHEALVALVKKFFAELPVAPKNERVFTEPVYQTGIFAQKRDIEQAHIMYGIPWMKMGNPDRFTASILSTILGGSMSSRLFQEVREKRGLAYSIYTLHSSYQDAGQWCIYAGTRPANLKEVIELIRAELERISQELVAADELQRTIDLICGQLVLGMETTNSHMLRLGRREVLGVDQDSVEEILEAYRSVTVEDVAAIAKQYLSTEATIAVVSPYDVDEIKDMIGK